MRSHPVTALRRIRESELGIIIHNWCTRQLPAWLVVASLLALGAPAFGATLEFVEMHRDGQAGVDGLSEPEPVAVSPDGRHLYAAGGGEDALAVLARDPVSGKLQPIQVLRDGLVDRKSIV